MCVIALLVMAGVLPGCAVSRKQEIKRLSNRVDRQLLNEQHEVLGRSLTDPQRSTRLDHLTTLKTTHSLADVGLASAPRFLEGDDLALAYDVLEEVFGVIEWNIPLMPGRGTKALPNVFGASGLNFSALQAGASEDDLIRHPSGFAQ